MYTSPSVTYPSTNPYLYYSSIFAIEKIVMKFFWEGIIDFDSSFSRPASLKLLITESIQLFIGDQAFS
jgi:hypothetical protein